MKKHNKISKPDIGRYTFVIPIALFALLNLNAQTPVTVPGAVKDSITNVATIGTGSSLQDSKPAYVQPDKVKIYTVVTKIPMFPGGDNELTTYIGHNLKYPLKAQLDGIQGRIIIRFVVTKFGKVEQAQVIRGLEPSMDQEGLRVINTLPDWIPGELNGERVSVYYTLPITFKLNGPNLPALDHKKMPIIVLDGKVLPVDYDMKTFAKDNIKSYNILKADTESKKADLIAKYGERAANGVIELTSKK
jgi:TonB family protein